MDSSAIDGHWHHDAFHVGRHIGLPLPNDRHAQTALGITMRCMWADTLVCLYPMTGMDSDASRLC